jgi:8-oxo-dGTP pyrophosphatase MutT (NUDIX family)
MKREISAGCVVYRIDGDGIKVVLIRPKDRDSWALPKGLVEQGESPVAAAEREAQEETGLQGTIICKIGSVKYTYTAKWENPPTKVFKIVTFYLMQYTGGDTKLHDWEVAEVEWYSVDEAISKAAYSSEKQILRKAKAVLANDL